MHYQLHLGVTGLRRTGKTVFLTSLIYQLTELGSKNLSCFSARGVTLRAARLENSRDSGLERFPYFRFLQDLRRAKPQFPAPTIRESGCTLQFGYENPSADGSIDRLRGWIGRARSHGQITLHLHDYPGEYLLDVGLLQQSYPQWSADTLERMWAQCPQAAHDYITIADSLGDQTPDEILAQLRAGYSRYVLAAYEAGLEFVQPSMTLIRWSEPSAQGHPRAKSPNADELPFVPLPKPLESRPELVERMTACYQEHLERQVKPFVKRIQRCHRQLVLVDVLRVLRNGVEAYNDTSRCIAEILRAYHNAWGPFHRIQQVLFAATKADHAPKNQRVNLTKLLDDLVFKARGAIRGIIPVASSEWFTSLQSTQDALTQFDGRPLDVLQGVRLGSQEIQAYHPGVVPMEWPEDEHWTLGNPMYDFPEWRPQQIPKKDGAILPHLNLDRIIWKILENCWPNPMSVERY